MRKLVLELSKGKRAMVDEGGEGEVKATRTKVSKKDVRIKKRRN